MGRSNKRKLKLIGIKNNEGTKFILLIITIYVTKEWHKPIEL